MSIARILIFDLMLCGLAQPDLCRARSHDVNDIGKLTWMMRNAGTRPKPDCNGVLWMQRN